MLTFKIPHPLVGPTTKDLVHSFIEGPQMVYLSGKVTLSSGAATVNLIPSNMTEGTFVVLNVMCSVLQQMRLVGVQLKDLYLVIY